MTPMNYNTAKETRDSMPKAIPLFPSENSTENSEEIIKVLEKPKRFRRSGLAQISDTPKNHAADAFIDTNDIDRIVEYLLCTSDPARATKYTKAAMFIVGINTGYRCGDLASLRVKDVVKDSNDPKSKVVDVIHLTENKTSKPRVVYLNKASKTAIRLIIDENGYSPDNYLFTSEGNKTAYFESYVYDKDGEICGIKTASERIRPNGEIRVKAPYAVASVARWLKQTTNELGIVGHYSSHAMRKTFAEHISHNFPEERNALVACKALGHADVDTTINHYMTVNPAKLRKVWLDLNLGLEPLEQFISENIIR